MKPQNILKNEHKNSFFQQNLPAWYSRNKRSYPWVGEKNPYKVWLSEIILQQTRVEQGLPYYQKLLAHFPTIIDLAQTEDQLVFRLWQGLGYYNRCKNMLKAARYICEKYKGVFPGSYEEILALPGVGPYTAAAISSFAFGLPHAVVDGNVERLLSRYFGIAEEVNSVKGKKLFSALANQLLDKAHADIYNQAIMDFGATVCLPKQPLCAQCPFRPECVAFNEGVIEKLPVKKGKKPVTNRYFYYFVFQYNGRIFIRKRPAGDIWENLHDFPLYEDGREQPVENLLKSPFLKDKIKKNSIVKKSCSPLYRHQLTHQKLHIRFFKIYLNAAPTLPEKFFPVELDKTDNFAFPRPLVKYLTSE